MAYECDEMLRDEVAAHAATRARLAQAEHERDEARAAERQCHADYGGNVSLNLALAASQASERELREALEHANSCGNKLCSVCAAVMSAALSRVPGSTEALAAWGDRLVRAFAKQRMIQVADTEVTEAVARVLDRSDTTEGGK